MPLDEILIAVALSAYTLGALALLLYFFARAQWLRDVGIPLAILGCVAQFAQLVARWELTHVWPLLNLYGSLSLFAAMSVAIFIVFAFRYDLWFAGGFVLALAAIFLAYGVTWYEGTMPPVPSLQSYWAKIHVPIVVSSYAAFLVAFVFSCIYLVKYYAEQRFRVPGVLATATAGAGNTAVAGNPVARWLAALPSLAQLDVIVY
ncbi:MAG: cytochrome c biogenesis protein CcsA, partial [Candidatus Cybelea sp.]